MTKHLPRGGERGAEAFSGGHNYFFFGGGSLPEDIFLWKTITL